MAEWSGELGAWKRNFKKKERFEIYNLTLHHKKPEKKKKLSIKLAEINK